MMISQRKNIPLVRVKGFKEPWELCTLGEHIEDYVEKTTVQNQYPVLTSSQSKGIVRQEDYFANRQVTTDSNIGYFVLPKGFFTYRSRSDNGVFKFNRNDLLDKGIISYFYPVFSIVEGDSDFYLKLLNTSITKQAMLQAEGTGQKVLSLKKFKLMKASMPSLDEQSAIGSLFRTLDDLLASYKDNLANYQDFKTTMLSKMFPKAGQSVPEIRLDGFEGDWKEQTLGSLGSVAMNKRIFKNETSENGDIPFYKIGTFGGTADAFISKEKFQEYKEKYPYPEIGDILISASGSIGRTVVYNGEDAYYQDSNIVWLKHDQQLDNSYLKQYYGIIKWSGIEGTTIKRLYNKNILETNIFLPLSVAEQQAIGAYFSNLDNLINSHQEKISQLETLKKKLLQDMFI